MIAAIDVGSHKICTLIGDALPALGVRVLGIGHAPSNGIRRGEIVHVEDAAAAIAASVERAERVAGTAVSDVIVGITGTHLVGANNQAVIPCGRRPRAIEAADVDRVLEVAGTIPLPVGREVLHVLPRHFCLDDGVPVVSPIGMEGYRLGTEVHIVTAAAATLGNMRRCLELSETGDPTLVMSTLAAGLSSLTADERELGVCLIDLGASATGLACYRDGTVVHSAVLPLGGRHMTNDLAVVLQTPLASAERIKTTHGHVLPEMDDDETPIEVEPFGEGERRTVGRRYVSEVLAARADELASLVWAEIERAELAGQLPAGAVLVGGGSELGGLARRCAQHWQCPVRIGRPTGVAGLADAVRGPAHAGALGLLLWRARQERDAAVPPPRSQRSDGLARVVEWARAAFLPQSRGC